MLPGFSAGKIRKEAPAKEVIPFMIQDIYPKVYHNEYKELVPTDYDLFLTKAKCLSDTKRTGCAIR